jgi:hypothetical protein
MIIRNRARQTFSAATGQRSAEASRLASLAWIVILTLAGVGGSLVISCTTPFAALAVALAGTVRLTAALRAIIAIWLTNQFIGFVFFHFPRTPNTILWGVAIGGAALLSTFVSATVLKHTTSLPAVIRLGLALLLGFALYETDLLVAALFLGGVETFSPAIIARLGFINFVWLVGLLALNEVVAVLCKSWIGMTPRLAKV